MQVTEIMTEASVTDSAADTVRAAARRMGLQQTGSLLIMDENELVGIVTERDVMKAVARGLDVEHTPVSEIMTRDVSTVGPNTSLHEAARHMAARWIRHLPVVDQGRVVGVVSQRDLVGVLAALDPDPVGVALANDELVRARRLARIEQGDLD
ncbi:MAG: CBS domain-containing protein [Actinomycetota bacterium]|nr:CBS domain-containing protein [Actinomycetota bacterium]